MITDEDYIQFVQRMSDKEALPPSACRRSVYRLRRWPTLFIGYSLQDYNLTAAFSNPALASRSGLFSNVLLDRLGARSAHPERLARSSARIITFFTHDLWTVHPVALRQQVCEKEYEP